MNGETPMTLVPDSELREICCAIVAEGLTLLEWSMRESDDMYQSRQYCGGFDASEQAFYFSYYSDNDSEWWFNLNTSEVHAIAAGKWIYIPLKPPQD